MRISNLLAAAADQARQLDNGWLGPEHVLLALLATPNLAADALGDVGVTYDRVRELMGQRRYDPDLPVLTSREGVRTNPAAHGLIGWAHGFAVASGHRAPRPEHWLIGLLYNDDRGAMCLHPFGVQARAVVTALAGRGVPVPDLGPMEYRPWRGWRHVYVAEEQLPAILDLLGKKHPPGSEWRWGFNLVGEPRRARIGAEEGIDLEAIVAEARGRPGS